MVGGLEAVRRVAAAALLAVGSLAPIEGPLVATPSGVTPVAETSTACAMTVGSAGTDPALAVDAARAVAVGYAGTDCMPDASLLAAAEARAAIPMESSTPTQAAAGGSLPGTSSSGSVAIASSGGTTVAPTPIPSPTATTNLAAGPTDTTTTGTDTSSTEGTGTTAGQTAANDGLPLPDNSDGIGSSEGSSEGSSNGSTDGSSEGSTDGSSSDDSNSGNPGTRPGTVTDGPAADGTTTAAGKLGWGTATGVEDFDGDLANWAVYDGPGHGGKGRRSPAAMTVNGGILTITGDANGTTGGMAWRQGRSKYGRWEARIKSPVADPSYNAVMLLWPDAENWPAGGEVDFMEIGDETRQKTDFFLHYGADNRQLHGQVQIDATQWHNWAVEWSPTKITAYVDGNEWYSTTQTSALPPDSMHLTLQLDWFPQGGTVQQSAMHVDWVRYYPITGVGDSGVIQNSPDTTSDTAVPLNSLTNTGAAGGTGTDGTGTDGTTTVPLSPETSDVAVEPVTEPAPVADSNPPGEEAKGPAGADVLLDAGENGAASVAPGGSGSSTMG